MNLTIWQLYDDVTKCNHFPHYWPFVRGIHRSREFPAQRPVTQSFEDFFICAWINDWVNNREAGDLRSHRVHYNASVKICFATSSEDCVVIILTVLVVSNPLLCHVLHLGHLRQTTLLVFLSIHVWVPWILIRHTLYQVVEQNIWHYIVKKYFVAMPCMTATLCIISGI